MKTYIIAGDRIVDGQGSHQETNNILNRASKINLRIKTLTIVNLAKRWEDKLSTDEFKSGASAMAAIESARKILKANKADLVVIKGDDFLKTGYQHEERAAFMKLYQNKYTPLDGYDRLVPLFLKKNKLSEEDYFQLRDLLFENYLRTWKKIDKQNKLPDERWYQPLTKYFRGVDCANPNIDYSGQILLASEKIADKLKVPKKKRSQILGNAFTKLKVDGLPSLPEVSKYAHLKRTARKAIEESKVNFKKEFFKGKALLDAYTCYPVVPLGLILSLNLVENNSEIQALLKEHEITVTGGLNLGKAAWNLTSLNAIIVMRERLISSRKAKYGLIHGNGSLGNQQGITLISN